MTETKLFPLRLPPNYHGKPKPFRRLSDVYVERSADRENPEFTQGKIANWQLKRLDKDVIRERRQFLVHPAKISQDTPDWFKTTLHHFHRTNYTHKPSHDHSQEMNFTVLNQRRVNPFLNTVMNPERKSRFRSTQDVAEKIGSRDTSYNMRWTTMREVTPKIGAVDMRDYTVPQPLLKIGQTHAHNFINTYQIA